MSTPIENQQQPNPLTDRLIDRLVDGELGEGERRNLLLRLESEPGGWRRCALAFLEAQNWREALAPVAASVTPAPRPPVSSAVPGRRAKRWRLVARLAGLAAGLAASFVLGWGLHRAPEEAAPQPPMARVLPPPSPPPQPQRLDHIERPPSPEPATELPESLESVVKLWEQAGYHAETQKHLVSMQLKDGRKADVPVHEVRFRYIGNRTY
jgi:hypothetical protein